VIDTRLQQRCRPSGVAVADPVEVRHGASARATSAKKAGPFCGAMRPQVPMRTRAARGSASGTAERSMPLATTAAREPGPHCRALPAPPPEHATTVAAQRGEDASIH